MPKLAVPLTPHDHSTGPANASLTLLYYGDLQCPHCALLFPRLMEIGIKRWVHGGFTFTPDGNPLVGRVAGVPNYWAACGCMAGFSQGDGIGLAVANWIADGDPGYDVFGMDVTRFGAYANNERYLRETTRQFYARRFVMAYPNEELPAGRPLKTTPA